MVAMGAPGYPQGMQPLPCPPRFDPHRPCAAAKLAILTEHRSTRLMLAPVGADAPTNYRARLANSNQTLRLRCELGEQHDASTRGDCVVAWAIQRGGHE